MVSSVSVCGPLCTLFYCSAIAPEGAFCLRGVKREACVAMSVRGLGEVGGCFLTID